MPDYFLFDFLKRGKGRLSYHKTKKNTPNFTLKVSASFYLPKIFLMIKINRTTKHPKKMILIINQASPKIRPTPPRQTNSATPNASHEKSLPGPRIFPTTNPMTTERSKAMKIFMIFLLFLVSMSIDPREFQDRSQQ